jgi:hypothetical protein
MTHNLGSDSEKEIVHENAKQRTVWVTSSSDDGKTWSEPREIHEGCEQSRSGRGMRRGRAWGFSCRKVRRPGGWLCLAIEPSAAAERARELACDL